MLCIHFLLSIKYMVLLFVGTSYGSNIGRIWHVTDIHYEPNYTAGDYPASSCRDLDGGTPGYWGDYRCDSPWALVNSSVYAMRSIEENPDFIIWTGDDTPHVPDDNLSTDKVIDIITNVTTLLSETFPGTTVFPVFGNHDYHPKHMFPPMTNPVYSTIADLWSHWLGDYPAFNEKFRKVAYYTAQFTAGLRIVGLNTVYYYTSNKVTEDLEDPGDQFVWLESVLNQAATDGEKVYIIGHVPPGSFERHASKSWFYPKFNKRYTNIVTKHADVISGQFFAHQHDDSFRMFYDSKGMAINSMFLTPAVTPWNTTLPGVGPNNPAIRLYEYNKDNFAIKDIKQYFLDLSQSGTPTWKMEYSATAGYGIPDVTTASLQGLVDSFWDQTSDKFDKYYLYNSVSYDKKKCDSVCRKVQLCAITNVDFDDYAVCISEYTSGVQRYTGSALTYMVILICLNVIMHSYIL